MKKSVISVSIVLTAAVLGLCWYIHSYKPVAANSNSQVTSKAADASDANAGVSPAVPKVETEAKFTPAPALPPSPGKATGMPALDMDIDKIIWNRSPLTGNYTDLSPDEDARAREVFIRERQMWLSLLSFAGDIRIVSYVDDKEVVILVGNVFLQKRAVNEAEKNKDAAARSRYRYDMVIKDKDNSWNYSSDGTRKGTVLHCSDERTSRVLTCILHEGIVQTMTTIPLDVLGCLDMGDNVPGGRLKEKVFFDNFPPWRNPKARNNPDSFMFKNPMDPKNVCLFEDGHFNYWGKGLFGHETVRVQYTDYQDIDGFSFPTKVIAYRGRLKTLYNYSNLIIHMSKN